jgi:hypothetical protein
MPSEQPPTKAAPDLRRGVLGRVVIPIALLVVIIGSSFRALSSAKLPKIGFLTCQMQLLRTDQPPADVVFFGSSRTGAAVDTTALAGALDGHGVRSVEKVMLTLGSELDRDLLFRTYTRHRGVPKVLAIEVSFERNPGRLKAEGMLRPTGRTATLFDAEVYAEFVGDHRARGQAGLFNTYVRSRFQSTPSFFFDRVGAGFDHALRTPQVVAFPVERCGTAWTEKEGRWVTDNSQPYDEATATKPSGKKQKKWKSQLAKYHSINFRTPWAKQELLLLRALVDYAFEVGVQQVLLYYLPSFRESPKAIDLRRLQALVPRATIFDGRTVMFDPARPTLQYQHFDANHINKFAAHEMSLALAHALDELEVTP